MCVGSTDKGNKFFAYGQLTPHKKHLDIIYTSFNKQIKKHIHSLPNKKVMFQGIDPDKTMGTSSGRMSPTFQLFVGASVRSITTAATAV